LRIKSCHIPPTAKMQSSTEHTTFSQSLNACRQVSVPVPGLQLHETA